MFYLLLMFFSLNHLPDAKIGMPINEFKALHPKAEFTVYETETTFVLPDTLLETPIEWGYRFKEKGLDWIYMSHYSDALNAENFEHCLEMAKNLIAATEKKYGAASSKEEGTLFFIDPYKDKHHWGYKVLEARWKEVNGMKIKVEFVFMGGKGEYSFLVKMNVFDKDYPYFD